MLVSFIDLLVVMIAWILYLLSCVILMLMFSNFVLVGDFNIDFSNCRHPLFPKLFSTTSSFSLYQIVKDFTHFNPSGSHFIIGLVFISSPALLISCSTIPPLSTSDHQGLHLCFRSYSSIKSLTSSRLVWCYKMQILS